MGRFLCSVDKFKKGGNRGRPHRPIGKKTIFSPKGGYSGYSGWALKYGDMCLNLK